MDKTLAEKFLEEESRGLESRYRSRPSTKPPRPTLPTCNPALDKIAQRCRVFEIKETSFANFNEEQERELAPENEQEREVERPAPAKAEAHTIDINVRHFVKSGQIPDNEKGFMWPFKTLRSTTAASQINLDQFPQGLRVTEDFARTVVMDFSDRGYDSYQRNVQWVLTGTSKKRIGYKMVMISPYGANQLLDEIRPSKAVVLHAYAPRQTRTFAPSDHLHLHTISESSPTRYISRDLIIELNIFAGQLYFSSFKEYIEVCDFLGLAWTAAEQGMTVRADGFIEPGPQSKNKSNFSQSPVPFLRLLLTKIRRDCGAIGKTHMDKVLDGTLLTENDFEARPKRRAEDASE